MSKKQRNKTSSKKRSILAPHKERNEERTPPGARKHPASEENQASTEISPKSEQKDSTSSPIDSGHRGSTTVYRYMIRLAKSGRSYLVKSLPALLSSASLMLLGFKEIPKSIPLLSFVSQHRAASPILGAVGLIILVVGLIISLLPEPPSNGGSEQDHRDSSQRIRPWVIATGLSTGSFLLSTTLLLIVLIRPVWCPAALCLAPQIPIYGPHDANLEVNFIALQSPSYVLTRQPSYYSLRDHLPPDSRDPNSIGALRIDEHTSSPLYVVALNIHNLRTEGYSMIIEQVALMIQQAAVTPNPLNVWVQPPSLVYQSGNLYNAVYWGQDSGTVVPATYVRLPAGWVQLQPLETDTIQLQVTPQLRIATTLRFSIRIIYRYANEAQVHIFTFPKVFVVIFAKASNWHPYHLQDGQFVAG